MFAPLPDKPDHDALERGILDVWADERTFEQVRAKNAEGPRFSFVDGPVTANKGLAVHTAWGRTLKDVFQRYKALRGYHQRYQNGFDCQGLWIEVGVEKSLGLNSKREIEEYGLAAFARKCREVVVWSSQELTEGSIRLGQWMDWGKDYFTFSDTNIEYIWRFLRIVHERGWLYLGHRSTEWCPRCGTSISAHELHGHYEERTDPSLEVRFRLRDRPGESVAVWTTTPWTLPANVAAAVKPDAAYGRLETGDWVAVALYPKEKFVETLTGADMVGWRYAGPFDALGPGAGVEHRVIPWEEVALDTGTGIVHIAPGCGSEDFELSRRHGLDVLTPVDENGRFYPEYGWLHGISTVEAAEQIVGDLEERGLLVSATTTTHSYPYCWRCHTPLIFRLSDDWFISVGELRPQLLAANATVEWTPAYMGKRMDDWLQNMGDWNISRRRYYGLPLPFYPCSCGNLNVIGSRRELEARATGGLEQLEELRRPWIDEVRIRCEACDAEIERIPEVGDVWLDAGIVPFSTLGWQSETYEPEGYATGAARGLTTADLPDHATWEQWFPADWVSEMREQIRLWFYSQLLMSVALVGRAPFRKVLGYEKMLDERGREMHGSWGNMIDAPEAFARMGADVMRWQYCAQPPDRNLLFGFGPAHEIQRKLLTLWNSAKFLVDYGNIESFVPPLRRARERAVRRSHGARPLARRPHGAARRGGDRRVRALADGGRDPCLRGVRRRSLQLVHPPVATALLGRRRARAQDALACARAGAEGDLARDAVPLGAPLAYPGRPVRAGARVGVPGRLAGARCGGYRVARRDRGRAAGGRPRPPGAAGLGSQGSPAAAPAGRGGCAARPGARRGDRRGAAGEDRGVRGRGGDGAAREAKPSRARAEARQGARARARRAAGRGVRGARGRPLPRARS
jgi:isoleucyl-tRNA synthetase